MLTLIAWLFAADRKEPLIDRLDPVTRAKVIAALIGLVVLGIGMILLVWLGGRMVRRYVTAPDRLRKRSRPSGPTEDDWWSKPLVPPATPDEDDADAAGNDDSPANEP